MGVKTPWQAVCQGRKDVPVEILQQVYALLTAARQAVRENNSNSNFWADLIRRAQGMKGNADLSTWAILFALVQIAIADEAVARTIRAIALEWYEDKAAEGDEEALTCLRGYALMAGDQDLLDRFYMPDPVRREITPEELAEWQKRLPEMGMAGMVVGSMVTILPTGFAYRRP